MTITPEQVQGRSRWQTPGPQPNGLQATPEGLWVIDQEDLNVYLLDWKTGSATKHFPTTTYHSSGITWDGEAVWVASTFTPIEIFRYSPDGVELKRLATPGASEKSGAHGLEWIDGKLWVTVPPSATTYQLDPEDGRILRQFPAPGNRPHGLAWDGETLWVAETTDRTITGYDLEGNVRRVLAMGEGPAEAPAPHGLTYHEGELWYCDAETRYVGTIAL
jgi:sugar lactone lactonase YvrE